MNTGRWVTIASLAIYVVVAWIVFEKIKWFLGYELAVSIILFVSVFAVVGVLKLGEWVEWNLRNFPR